MFDHFYSDGNAVAILMRINLNYKELTNLNRKISNHKEMNLSNVYGFMSPSISIKLFIQCWMIIEDFQIVAKMSQICYVWKSIKYFFIFVYVNFDWNYIYVVNLTKRKIKPLQSWGPGGCSTACSGIWMEFRLFQSI